AMLKEGSLALPGGSSSAFRIVTPKDKDRTPVGSPVSLLSLSIPPATPLVSQNNSVSAGAGGSLGASLSSVHSSLAAATGTLGGTFPFPYPASRLWPAAPPLGISSNLLRDAPFTLLPFLPRQPGLPAPGPVTAPVSCSAHTSAQQTTYTSSPIHPITTPLLTSAGAYCKAHQQKSFN
ncbi:unnamed protein product, partial [Meganyctiphanes norvegica]